MTVRELMKALENATVTNAAVLDFRVMLDGCHCIVTWTGELDVKPNVEHPNVLLVGDY